MQTVAILLALSASAFAVKRDKKTALVGLPLAT